MSAETITLGCRLNFAESEAMAAGAPEGSLIVNSCAVTSEAVRQTRQAIRRAHRENPARPIIVTGCAVQLDPEAFRAMPEVTEVRLRDDSAPALASAGLVHSVKSFVAVQTGCDHRCTFCTIWTARGPSRSVTYAAVRDAVERELARGAKEIVLTGVDITDYDGGLGRLCQRLLSDLPGLKRLRLSSLDSIEIDGALIELIAGEPRLMPHFHLSLQAGDDLVLKRMKRRHLRRDAVATVAAIKAARPEATIGADLIAGFPTESEAAAHNTLALLDDCDVVAAHIFPFSPRPGTPAARMPQVERELVKARAARLRDRAAVRRSNWLDGLVGSHQRVLIENERGEGHGASNAPVRIAGAAKGSIIDAIITARYGNHLIGNIE
ncbi:radical SAM protein [Sphingomonas sp.]|uniref:MiaB/RimO family radical SAM methylthiotransferase n=1 Tax=Sphingomonas sp. TaxID=28214 RepID=UPI00286C2113|nr:radical SAM protein [Sphingomonas sp.]